MYPAATRLRRLAALAAPLAVLLVQASAASAAPPPNDLRSAPAAVGALPATLSGTTVESTVDIDEPPSSCGAISPKGSVWYALSNAEPRDLLVALDAGGDMDATVEVFRRERSQVSFRSGATRRTGAVRRPPTSARRRTRAT